MFYMMERLRKEPGMGGAVIHLDPSKSFDKVDLQSLEAVLEEARFSPVFGDICLVVKVNDHLSEVLCRFLRTTSS